MSTRGTFVIIKGGVGKELDIRHDACPEGAGEDITELIKSVNLSQLYDRIKDFDDAEMDYYDAAEDVGGLESMNFPDEPDAFNILQCRKVLKGVGTLYGTVPGDVSGCNPVFTEYAYVIDLDEGRFTLFRNRCILRRNAAFDDGHNVGISEKGDSGNDIDSHAVALTQDEAESRYILEEKAIFDLEFIKRCGLENVVSLMSEACEDECGVVAEYTATDLTPEMEIMPDHIDDMDGAGRYLRNIAGRMRQCGKKISGCRPYGRRRANEILHSCQKLDNSLKELEERIELLT